LKKLLIYTGPVKSGKSTKLLSFVQSRNDAGGILSPLIEGKKYLYDISSDEKKLLEAEADDREDDIISIGRYKFQKKVFEWAKEELQKAFEGNYSYLIIDEIGPLEFRGEGLSPVADEIIRNYNSCNFKIIVVFREHLTSHFLEHFKLNPADIEFFSFS
jgi:nucleoside-triphosphatase THEP1